MRINRRRFTQLSLAAAATPAAFAIGGKARAADPLKIGFVYVGPIGDHGWTYQHDQGRLAVEEEFGDQVETSFVENVSEGADAERVINQLATTGHGLIFTTSFGFMNPTLKVAKRHPDVRFEHATGYKRADNLATYAARFYEGRTVSGILAAHVTKTNTIGYIASFPIPEVVRGIGAFTVAARRINPDLQVKVVWVNSWYDPGKEADAAKALIDQGADVLLQHTDSPAPVQVAEERGVKCVGQASDMSRFGPTAHMTAVVDDWAPYYKERVKLALDGGWSATDTWGGLASGMVKLSPFNGNLPAEAISDAEAAIAAIESGERHAFDGPVRDQSGTVRVPEGEHLSDEGLLGMDWYVEGVQGKLPG
ncbi:BMP family ABC transporter substrate-binding protein [Marivibrio halodurans]|uniref:BMP family ABC transporter substrate-binding protein n=1 Tax=Marivibrio halodurans TaxID=2039722 RepID=A0A8J7RVN5_9PROT|nr:BMP family ABC transporter substrate-binding protein [Marivibrio halodurans]MBP5855542.1 BMP family ABC transporter substrate-binding protein [Marivibrio halodurans]